MLLDTHALIWLLDDNDRLGPAVRRQIASAPAVHVSAASVWEIAIKQELGRLAVPANLLDLIEEAGLQFLAIAPRHAWAVGETDSLPHRDPFDRLLITQAVLENFPFVTADRIILAAEVAGLDTVDARL